MINLLPPEQKRQIRARQSNSLLLRYCILTLVLALLLFAMSGGVYMMMLGSKKNAEKTIEQNSQKSIAYKKVREDALKFTNDLATVKAILDKEVSYSNIAIKIAQTLPPDVVLQSLQLNYRSFGQPTTLNALGKSHGDSVRLKTALEKSELFSDVHIQSTAIQDSEQSYPFVFSVSVTIKPEVAKL